MDVNKKVKPKNCASLVCLNFIVKKRLFSPTPFYLSYHTILIHNHFIIIE